MWEAGMGVDTDERPYWLGFHLVPGIGATRLARLVEAFGGLAAAWQAGYDALRAAGLNDRAARALITTRERIALDAEMERVRRSGATILTLADDAYPPLLREIPSPPPVIYVRGEIQRTDALAVAVVGTRHAGTYGREMTRKLVAEIVPAGVTVVSGLARGIDAVAPETALGSGGRTTPVLGGGIAVMYPPEHRQLADRITESGAVITEFPIGTRPDAANFPVRNRLISGLSRGVVVVEAPAKSGALITANFAADQGRTVFAVPGSALSANSVGPHRLLRDGAALATSGEDILAELQLTTHQTTFAARDVLPATDAERLVLRALDAEARHIDDIALEAGLAVSELSAVLLQMQLKGIVRNVGAQHYVLA